MWTYLTNAKTKGIYIGLLVSLFLSILAFFFFLLVKKKAGRSEQRRQRTFERLNVSYYRRQREEETKWLEDGEQEKKSVLFRLDRLIDYSGLRLRIPFLSAEVLIVSAILICALFFFLGLFSRLTMMSAMAISGSLMVFGYVMLRYRADRNYDAIENGLFAFVNIVGTQSRSSDDLVTILDASVKSLCAPLQELVARCCVEARNTGRLMESLYHLEQSVENAELRKIIRNLAMCYRTDADYSRVLEECRVGLKEHIASREERLAMNSNHRIELMELTGIGVLSLYLIGNIIGEQNVFTYLHGFTLGRIVLLYILAVMGWCVVDAILMRGSR